EVAGHGAAQGWRDVRLVVGGLEWRVGHGPLLPAARSPARTQAPSATTFCKDDVSPYVSGACLPQGLEAPKFRRYRADSSSPALCYKHLRHRCKTLASAGTEAPALALGACGAPRRPSPPAP